MTNEREERVPTPSQPRRLLRYYSSSSRLWRGKLSAEEEGEGVEEEEEEEEDGQRRAS